jgi:hypothetical protein
VSARLTLQIVRPRWGHVGYDETGIEERGETKYERRKDKRELFKLYRHSLWCGSRNQRRATRPRVFLRSPLCFFFFFFLSSHRHGHRFSLYNNPCKTNIQPRIKASYIVF